VSAPQALGCNTIQGRTSSIFLIFGFGLLLFDTNRLVIFNRIKAMTPSQLPAKTLFATRAFAERVAKVYPTQKAILFGSRARGTAHEESDADVAVILLGKAGHFVKTKMAMSDIAYDILLDTGIRIQPLPVWEYEWAHPESYSNPHLLRNIAIEGIAL
jgi:antitoxin ChpS